MATHAELRGTMVKLEGSPWRKARNTFAATSALRVQQSFAFSAGGAVVEDTGPDWEEVRVRGCVRLACPCRRDAPFQSMTIDNMPCGVVFSRVSFESDAACIGASCDSYAAPRLPLSLAGGATGKGACGSDGPGRD